jgi:hypothetical protein
MFQAINLKLRKILESRACYWLIAVAVVLSVYEDIVLLFPSRLRLVREMTSNEVVFVTCGIAFLFAGLLMFTHCLYVSGLSAREKTRWIAGMFVSFMIVGQIYFWVVYRKRVVAPWRPTQ